MKMRNFIKTGFNIKLTPMEQKIIRDNFKNRYYPSIKFGFLWALLALPGALYIDLTLLGDFLIPIIMVTGTVWFSISVTSSDSRYKNFENSLCRQLLNAFVLSICLSVIIFIGAVFREEFILINNLIGHQKELRIISMALMGIVSIRLCYTIIFGAIKDNLSASLLTKENKIRLKAQTLNMLAVRDMGEKISSADKVRASYFGAKGIKIICRLKNMILKDIDATKYRTEIKKYEKIELEMYKIIQDPESLQKTSQSLIKKSIKIIIDDLNESGSSTPFLFDVLKEETNDLQKISEKHYQSFYIKLSTIFITLEEIFDDHDKYMFYPKRAPKDI